MHSKIFQVSVEPIEKGDYIKACNYEFDHWFTMSYADYVNDGCNRDKDIEWLKSSMENSAEFNEDEYGKYFIVKSKAEYFKPAFERFKKEIDKIKDATIDEFASGKVDIWNIKDAYDDKFGFYIDDDADLFTLDTFVRCCTEGEKYYLGGTVDYHF